MYIWNSHHNTKKVAYQYTNTKDFPVEQEKTKIVFKHEFNEKLEELGIFFKLDNNNLGM